MTAKILIVDDEVLFQRVIVQQFKREITTKKYEFIFAFNGKEALKLIESGNQADLMLLDIKMPEIDGLTLLTQLNQRQVNVKTIIVSAYGDMSNIRKAMQEKACDFLIKPVTIQDLKQTIERTLQLNTHYLRAQAPPLVRTRASEVSTLDVKEKKPHPNHVLRLAKEQPVSQRIKIIFQLIETIDNPEEVEDIVYKAEAQVQIAIDNEAEREALLFENQKREINNEPPLPLLENGWVEMRYMTRTLSTGEKKRYGPYYYWRWREGGKQRSQFLGKEDPRPMIESKTQMYTTDSSMLNKSSLKKELSQEKRPELGSFEKEVSQEKRRKSQTFRLDLGRPPKN